MSTDETRSRRWSGMTIGAYIRRPDGSRVVLREPERVAPDSARTAHTGAAYPACSCPVHTPAAPGVQGQAENGTSDGDPVQSRFRRCGDKEHCSFCRTATFGVVEPRQGPPVENCWADWLSRFVGGGKGAHG